MQLSRLLFCIALLCAPVALFSTTWLYLYPIFHGCAFPTPPAVLGQPAAPFRLLALGDPQLEGDSSLPDPYALVFPSLEYIVMHLRDATSSTERRSLVAEAAKGVVRDARRWLEGKRKAIDLWGNDWYLAHIVRSQRWWTQPTHISVLGDLLGSQWVTDGEFEKRAGRYWGTVMKGLEKVPDSVFGKMEEDGDAAQEEADTIVAEMPSGDDVHGESVQAMADIPSEGGLEESAESAPEESLETILETSADVVPEHVEAVSEPIEATPEPIETVLESIESISEEPTETSQSNAQQQRDDDNSETEMQHDETSEGERSEDNDKSEEEPLSEALKGQAEGSINGHEEHHEGTSDHEQHHEETSDEEHHEGTHEELHDGTHESPPVKERKPTWGGTREVLGADQSWEKRVINIVGNHDIGYAGDLDESRVERFEKAFGDVNWDIWFTLPEHLHVTDNSDVTIEASDPPALRLVVLNSMNLDTPAWSNELQTETYSFMNHIITSSRPVTDKTHATILLTHIPLEKESGVCVDSPYFDFWEGGHGVKEQNMLGDHSSKILLEGIFGLNGNKYAEGGGMGRRGIVVNGHDHAGCDVTHWIKQLGVEHSCNASTVKQEEAYWPPLPSNDATAVIMPKQSRNDLDHTNPFVEAISLSNEEPEPEVEAPEQDPMPKWKARRFPTLSYDINEKEECTVVGDSPNIREITLRSMMGEFSGYAGFLSAWFDPSLGEKGEWVFEFNTCGLGIQHWWWAVHSIDFGVVVMLVGAGVASILEKTVWKEKKRIGSSTSAKGLQGTNGTTRETKRRA